MLHSHAFVCPQADALQYRHAVRRLDEGAATPRDIIGGVCPDDDHRAHLLAREGQQTIGILEQDDRLAGDLPCKLSVFPYRKRADLGRMIKEAKGEHRAQDAPHFVVEGSQAHLPRMNRLHEPFGEELRTSHLLV